MIYSDRYIAELELVNATDRATRALEQSLMWITTNYPYLKCVKAIPACPDLEVGDLLWGSYEREIWEGGYEYVVTHRREDGRTIRFRADHLDDCFEVVEVEDRRWIRDSKS